MVQEKLLEMVRTAVLFRIISSHLVKDLILRHGLDGLGRRHG